jgi:hypothetical protein
MAWSGFDRAVALVPGGARAVFRAIGVPLGIVDRPGMSVSFRQYVAYFEAAARLGRDPDFGHKFGMRTRAEQSGIPGHLVLNARRFRDAIRDLARTLPTLVQGLRPELVEDRDPPALIWSIAPGVGPAHQFIRFVNAYLVRMLQAHRGPRWHPVRVMYAAPPPARPAMYASQLGCPVVFDTPVSLVERVAVWARRRPAWIGACRRC